MTHSRISGILNKSKKRVAINLTVLLISTRNKIFQLKKIRLTEQLPQKRKMFLLFYKLDLKYWIHDIVLFKVVFQNGKLLFVLCTVSKTRLRFFLLTLICRGKFLPVDSFIFILFYFCVHSIRFCYG